MILGGGPNRIGQGIEFDYCCCQAAFALREAGYETIMVNSNPETVSTDYDTSDHLFFEPLTAEDVLNICDRDAAEGADRAVRRADAAEPGQGAGSGRRADHRHQRRQHRHRRGPRALSGAGRAAGPASSRPTAPPSTCSRPSTSPAGSAIPVLVRPSYVLGGRAMEIVYDEDGTEPLRRPGAGRVAGQADPDRQVPRVGHRGRRRLPQRRHAHAHRRRDAAHRGGRHPLRRLGLRHPAAQPARRRRRGDQAADARAGPRAERQGPDERAVRRRRHRAAAR